MSDRGVETCRRTLDRLVQLLARDDMDFDRLEALSAEVRAEADASLRPALDRHLAAFVDAGNWLARDEIALILHESCGLSALPALLRAASRDLANDQDSLTGCIDDLFHTDPAAARLAVLDCVASPDMAVRRIGIWGLGSVGDEEDRHLVLAAATDADPRIRSVAMGALRFTAGSDPEVTAALEAGTRDTDPDVRVSAVSKLGVRVRDAACRVLGQRR